MLNARLKGSPDNPTHNPLRLVGSLKRLGEAMQPPADRSAKQPTRAPKKKKRKK